ncbi:MAG: hypothetical protein ACYCST_07100 [Acidimicrobiales bacterium]
MVTTRASRTIRCLYCGEETTEPSRRGPAPSYCSAAHRQAMYRERHRPPELRTGSPAMAKELELFRVALAAAAGEARWLDARRILLDFAEKGPDR